MLKLTSILLVVEDGEDHALVVIDNLNEKLKVVPGKETSMVKLSGNYPGHFVPLDKIALRSLQQMGQMVKLRERIINAALIQMPGATKDEDTLDKPDPADSAGGPGS